MDRSISVDVIFSSFFFSPPDPSLSFPAANVFILKRAEISPRGVVITQRYSGKGIDTFGEKLKTEGGKLEERDV